MNRLIVLGQIDLVGTDRNGVQALLGQPKRLALLAYLAMAAPGYRSRETLFAMFWPESDAERARQALNQALHHLRRSLEPDVILSRGNEVGVSPLRFGCDAVDFSEALRRGDRSAALSLYQGDLLPGFHVDGASEFERWMEEERGSLRMRAGRAAWALAEEAVDKGELSQAGRYARRAATLSVSEETVVRAAIDLLDRIGDRAGALDAYEQLARRLMEDYQAEPSAETRALIARVRSRTDSLQPTPDVVPPVLPGEPAPPAGAALDADSGDPLPEAARGAAKSARHPHFRLRAALATALVLIIAAVWLVRSSLMRPPPEGDPRIRVERFEALTGDPETAAFARAFTTALISHLSSAEGLEIVGNEGPPAQASGEPRRFELVVRGSVLESNGVLRINVELAESNGRTLGAKAVDRPAAELFSLIDGASQEVGRLLRAQLGREVRLRRWQAGTQNVTAWKLVQRAEESRVQATDLEKAGSTRAALASLAMADSLLARAGNEDPRWTEPPIRRALLAEKRAFTLRFDLGDRSRAGIAFEEAISHATRALQINSDDPAALELHARMVYRQVLQDGQGGTEDASRLNDAERDLRRVVQLEPGRATAWNTLSSLLFMTGDFNTARWAAEQAFGTDAYLEFEQDNLIRLFQTSYEVGDTSGMRRWCGELGQRLPGGQARAFCELQILALVAPPARANIDRAWQIMERPTDFGSILQNAPMLMTTAAVIARAGIRDSAEQVIRRANAAGAHAPELLTLEAYVQLQLARPDSAARLLETFFDLRPLYQPSIIQSRRFAPLREHLELRRRIDRE